MLRYTIDQIRIKSYKQAHINQQHNGVFIIIMKEANKQEPYLKRKPLKGQLNRQVKFINKPSQLAFLTSEIKSLKSKIKQNQSILNVSLIQGSSFISNKQDGSLDSMDKIIIGVTAMGIDEKSFQQESQKQSPSKGSATDFDFTQIHKQYEKLIGRNQLLGEEDEQENSVSVEETSRVLPDQDDWQLKQALQIQKRLSLSVSPKKRQYTQNQIKLHLQRIQLKVDQIKTKKIQDNSSNSIKILLGNVGNLSEIHEERQNNLNTSVDTDRKRNNQEDEQDFIDFVRQPDPQENNQNIQKKHYFPDQNQGNEWEVSPMFEHLQLELEKDKDPKKTEKSANYQQILQALNSKQQQQTPSQFHQIFNKREQWIRSHKQKSEAWKKKQLKLFNKMKKIVKNPQYDSEESEQV